jgi:VWFA-related protein
MKFRKQFQAKGFFFRAAFLTLSMIAIGQDASQKSDAAPATAAPAQPVTTFKANANMVTIEVVVRDKQGHPVPGLTAKDFEVSEQIPPKKDQKPESIASFQAVSMADLRTRSRKATQMPPGVFTNLVTLQNMTVPPTILLIDGINTSFTAQMQMHRQMIKLLGSIPDDVPSAIFLMDQRLHLLQNFTTDPKLLRAAALKASSLESAGNADVDPRDDPNALSALLADAQSAQGDSGAMASMQRFESETFSFDTDTKVRETLDALRGIARFLAGYPGRKNLLWVSSSFPLLIGPDTDNKFTSMRMYQPQMDEVATALADAQVAVYPMDPAGLETQHYFDASTRVTNPGLTGGVASRSVQREDVSRFSKQASMELLAEETGGRICVNNNDLSDCVRTAVNDGTSYYELGYYPDASNWHGEFHKIVVKTGQSGVHLAYREGYFARPQGPPAGDDAAKQDAALQQAACQDMLSATSILVITRAVPADQPNQAKYFLAIDPSSLTFTATGDGARDLRLGFAICTFDKAGKPLQYFHDSSEQKLTEQQYAAILARHGIPHPVSFVPDAATKRVRLLVLDKDSGRMGALDVPFGADASPAATPANNAPGASGTAGSPPAAH